MKHLIICPEYPPASRGGGIGTYVYHISHLFAEAGETVHVIAQASAKSPHGTEEKIQGRLIIHRLSETSPESLLLSKSEYPRQSFAWEAGGYAEKLIGSEGIDLIESQEFQAPLYFFQLRRALGLGPKQMPPVLIHLHSPTQLTTRYNDRDPNFMPSQIAYRLESYSIASADALLCPSHYLASQMASELGLNTSDIAVIPLPLGNTRFIERSPEVWRNGSICYVGRLERRKGILEWIAAAVEVASKNPNVRFEFVGANILQHGKSHEGEMQIERIPEAVAGRFHFYDHTRHSEIPNILSKARIAAVPSRWENFPNTCVEAMASGLPVIATTNGGMAEMISDGKTGWLSTSSEIRDLIEAIERALAVSPAVLSRMGEDASKAIHALCDNHRILEQQLSFRRSLAAKGATSSLHLPSNLPHLRRRIPHVRSAQSNRSGSIVIVSEIKNKNRAIESALSAAPETSAFIFLKEAETLSSNAIHLIESVLQRQPEAGVISFWAERSGGKRIMNPCPTFPYQWMRNDALECSAFRTEALLNAGKFRDGVISHYQYWDLTNAIMACGWAAVTIPTVLCKESKRTDPLTGHGDFKFRSLLLERFPELVKQDAAEMIQLAISESVWLRQELRRKTHRFPNLIKKLGKKLRILP